MKNDKGLRLDRDGWLGYIKVAKTGDFSRRERDGWVHWLIAEHRFVFLSSLRERPSFGRWGRQAFVVPEANWKILSLWSLKVFSLSSGSCCSLSPYISKDMELFHELFLTVAITVVFSFAISKIFLLGAGGGVKEDALLGSCKGGESGRGGRFVEGGSGLEGCGGESVVGKLEVREVLNDVDGDVGLGERLVGGGCGEQTVEGGGIAADLVEECVEGEGSSERREAVEDGVAVGFDKRLIEGGCGGKTVEVGEIAADLVEECVEDERSSEKRETVEDDVAKRSIEGGRGGKKVEVGEIAADLVEECVEDEGSSERREAVEDDVAAGLEKRLIEGGRGERTVEVGEIAADLVAECVEDGGSSETREAVEDDLAVGFGKRLMEGGSGEKTAEGGEIAADLVEECVEDEGSSEKKEAVEDDVAVRLEKRLAEEGSGEKMKKACDGIGGVEAHLIEGYAEDEGSPEKEWVEEVTVVGLEGRLMKGDCGEEKVEVSDGISEVGDGACSEKTEKVVELEEALMKGDCGEQKVEVGDGANKVEAISVHECVDHERNSEKIEAVDSVECEVKDEVGDEREDFSDDDDDWEGIQRTDLDRAFGAAVAFVSSEKNANNISNLNSDVKMQLSGLYKVATEGPCQEPPPMALKISARAKW